MGTDDIVLFVAIFIPGMLAGLVLGALGLCVCGWFWRPAWMRHAVLDSASSEKAMQRPSGLTVGGDELKPEVIHARPRRERLSSQVQARVVFACESGFGGTKIHSSERCSGMKKVKAFELCQRCFG